MIPAEASQPILSARNIHKYYGDLHVLQGVDLDIHAGEIVSMVGPSGSGKSTLLHILGTLDEAAQGEIRLKNRELHSLKGNGWLLSGTAILALCSSFTIYFPNLVLWKTYAYRPGSRV